MLGTFRKVELLAPAGNFEKLETAIHYGADAVYLGGKNFSLRNFSDNFSLDEIRKAADLAHRANARVYVACNIYARNKEQAEISEYLRQLDSCSVDAIIVSDPGLFLLARENIPDMPIHISTQANTTNYNAALFWQNLGAHRIVAARELSLEEIEVLASKCRLEVEAFLHGAMCISYSGRCLLSSYLADRDANRGLCAHPCRWRYAIVEASRPGQYLPIAEDQRGTYIFNSKDLCMVAHLPELIATGVRSLKIEGRMKGIHYLATAVKVYREAIDRYYESPQTFQVNIDWLRELEKINHRGFSNGFYFGAPEEETARTENPQANTFVAKVVRKTEGSRAVVDIRNKVFDGDRIEILRPKGPALQGRILGILNMDGGSQAFAQPEQRVALVLDQPCTANDLIRKIG